MKVAAYQAPLLPFGSMDAIDLIRERVRQCERAGVSLLCCPEGILGGLADLPGAARFQRAEPEKVVQTVSLLSAAGGAPDFAIDVQAGELATILQPLASPTVTTIIGFTEIVKKTQGYRLYNSAAVFQSGTVAGLYRKLHPAINKSVYYAADQTPVFKVGGLTFGIIICNDSNFPEPARLMAAQGATALFVPTNNGLPAGRGLGAKLVAEARSADIARSVENSVWVIRADVAGRSGDFVSHGSSAIVDPAGRVVQTARDLSEDLIVAEIDRHPG